jgi:BMFP domain-containing protein YqiC
MGTELTSSLNAAPNCQKWLKTMMPGEIRAVVASEEAVVAAATEVVAAATAAHKDVVVVVVATQVAVVTREEEEVATQVAVVTREEVKAVVAEALVAAMVVVVTITATTTLVVTTVVALMVVHQAGATINQAVTTNQAHSTLLRVEVATTAIKDLAVVLPAFAAEVLAALLSSRTVVKGRTTTLAARVVDREVVASAVRPVRLRVRNRVNLRPQTPTPTTRRPCTRRLARASVVVSRATEVAVTRETEVAVNRATEVAVLPAVRPSTSRRAATTRMLARANLP